MSEPYDDDKHSYAVKQASFPPVHTVLANVMLDVISVPKTDHNKAQNFEFRGIDAIINAVGPAFRRHGIVVVPHEVQVQYRDVLTVTGKPSRECTLLATYRFYGPTGDHLDVQVPGEALDASDKGTAKAMSVAYRIALIQALCLPTGERDPDHDTVERGNVSRADALRAEIKAVAAEKNILTSVVAEDFTARTNEDIRIAPATMLEPYLTTLRTYTPVGAT